MRRSGLLSAPSLVDAPAQRWRADAVLGAVRRPRICPKAGVTGTVARPHDGRRAQAGWAGERAPQGNAPPTPPHGVMRGSVLALAAAVLIAGCGTSTGTSAPATPAPPSTPRPPPPIPRPQQRHRARLTGHSRRFGPERTRSARATGRSRPASTSRPVRPAAPPATTPACAVLTARPTTSSLTSWATVRSSRLCEPPTGTWRSPAARSLRDVHGVLTFAVSGRSRRCQGWRPGPA